MSKCSSVGSNIWIVKFNPYNRKSFYNFKEYVWWYEIVFRLGPNQYLKDSTRVLYTIQFLISEIARVFEYLEEINELDTML